MKAIIHIGTPKTGTTALQGALKWNRKHLLSQKILYPDAGRKFDVRELGRNVGFRFAMTQGESNGMMGVLGLNSPKAIDVYRERFVAEFDAEISRSPAPEIVVLSDEALFEFSDPAMIENSRNFLSGRFDEVEILCYLKGPVAYLSSAYSQAIKMGATQMPAAFVKSRQQKDLYLTKLRMWAETFGMPSMRVKVLSGDILQSFSSYLQKTELFPQLPGGLNQSLTPTGVKLLRDINRQTGRSRPPRIRKAFERAMVGRGWKLPAAIATEVVSRFASEQDALLETFLTCEEDREAVRRSWSDVPAPDANREEHNEVNAALAELVINLAGAKPQ